MKSFVRQESETLGNLAILRRTREVDANSDSSFQLPNLHSRVTRLADSITDEAVRIVVSKVMADLVFLLDYLGLVDAAPHEPTRVPERQSILEAVRGEAFSLVEFIENRLKQLDGADEGLIDTLDGSAYAIQHEVRRVFECEVAQIKSESDEMMIHGLLLYSHGVLTNCFQQCMINLARVFDDGLTGERLFEDWRIKRERSLTLYRDLEALTNMLQNTESEFLSPIACALQSFKEGSMRWLMYKDWQEYQALAEPIIESIQLGENPTDLLHRLGCYLQTLLAHVKARGVLADLIFEPCQSFDGAVMFA